MNGNRAYGAPSSAGSGTHNENVASDNAHVDQQVGNIYGDAVFHNESTYNYSADDPPDRKFAVAFNFLWGGVPRQAEHILRMLIDNGHATTDRLYYYVLAVLSERSLSEIDEQVFANLRDAFRMAETFPRDDWRTALSVVDRLVAAAQKQEDSVVDVTDREAVRRFEELPGARQDEIRRYLAQITKGVEDERTRAAVKQRVSTDRLDNDRVGRAWKFFQADPALPRLAEAAPVAVAADNRTRLLVGGGAVALGLIAGFASLGSGNPVAILLGLVLVAAGGCLVVHYGGEREAERLRGWQLRNRYAQPATPKQAVSPGHWVRTDFVRDVHQRVETRFGFERPHDGSDWTRGTQGYRDHLKDRLVSLYGNARVKPAEIDWLIRWHAKRVRDQWRAGTFAGDLRGQPDTPAALVGGFAAMGLGFVLLLAGGAVAAAVLCGGGAYYAARAAWQHVGVRLRLRTEQVEEKALYEAECQGHREWVANMADRPTDAEMGRWLELDRMFLWLWAVDMYKLPPQEVVANVILTEGAPKAAQARVPGGPPRFSRYRVMIFLLTGNGVRQVSVDLDFLQGRYDNENRRSYRYDVLGSAAVVQAGRRSANDENGTSVMQGRKFTLSLLDQNSVEVVVREFDDIIDIEREDGDQLMRMALETSGISHALHVLEAVSAEGTTWLTRERERTRRRSRRWFGEDEAAAPDVTHLFSPN